ncbi:MULTISPECIES: DUF2292 domain-containing protein [Bacillaceae]|nr:MULTISPECIES: DUF2292 domain-containing protein [Bacillaceae]PLR66241.1 DUF2292 domain-containing protein [Bacillus sp. UMB0893]QNG58248.1 DUF2292 domain-containing protein [Bacillus sp. PAMC26568]
MDKDQNETIYQVLELINKIKDGSLIITFYNGEITQLDSTEYFYLMDDI